MGRLAQRMPVRPWFSAQLFSAQLFSAQLAATSAVLCTVLLCLPGAGGAAGPAGSWLGWGNGQQRWDAASTSLASVGRRFVLPLPGRITNQVLAANGSFYVATSSGTVAAFDGNGFERWQTEVGQFAQPCKQLNGYGVTGTGVIDPSSATLYVADAFGRLHALSLATGKERAGWPVQVYNEPDKQLDWGGLTLVGGAVYVPAASYCDGPSLGGIYRVDLKTRAVSGWVPVPASLGGGGGPWGWGGLAYSTIEGDLFTATSNAFSGGTNVGSAFSESAGYGEHLVQLTPDLTVRAASHPPDLLKPLDLDMTGSPLVFTRKGCGELVVADDKDDIVYGWRAGNIAAGPIWELPLDTFNPGNPLLSQLAWSQPLSSLYAVTGTHFVRITIGADCQPTAAWMIPLGTITENGSPTVAGNTVWFAVNKTRATTLNGYDARTGRLRQQLPLGGLTLTAPTVVNGELVIGTFTGLVQGFAASGASAGAAQPGTASEVSRPDAKHAWESRSDGVFATSNGGKSWKRIYAQPANDVLELSTTAGVIDVPTSPGRCMCDTRKLWTTDGGLTWRQTNAIGGQFAGSGDNVYWWQAGKLYVITGLAAHAKAHQPLSPRLATSIPDGTIVAAAPIAGQGVAVLVSNRVDGLGWDTNPRVLIVHGSAVKTATLPAQSGEILARTIRASGANLTVTGTNFAPNPAATISWHSGNGGTRWAAG